MWQIYPDSNKYKKMKNFHFRLIQDSTIPAPARFLALFPCHGRPIDGLGRREAKTSFCNLLLKRHILVKPCMIDALAGWLSLLKCRFYVRASYEITYW